MVANPATLVSNSHPCILDRIVKIRSRTCMWSAALCFLILCGQPTRPKPEQCFTQGTAARSALPGMVRKFKFHEEKLLKKVDFLEWKENDNPHEAQVMRRYHIQKREDYVKYNKICGIVTKLANELSLLPPEDQFRKELSAQLLDKLFQAGLVPHQYNLSQLSRVTVSSLCRRRLAVLLNKVKMCETLAEATTFIEQGHIRIGPEAVRDPSFLVPRNMEDFITWAWGSKIKRKVMQYNDQLDDYDLLQ